MTLTQTWRVLAIQKDFDFDLTSRVVGMQVNQQLKLAAMGSGRAVLSLNNNDGALTPGNGGAYTSTDWFSYGLRIECTVSDGTNSKTARLFDGIIAEFVVQDDGKNSFVTLEADDFMTVAGRSPIPQSISITFGSGITSLLNGVYQVPFPALGGTNPVPLARARNTPRIIFSATRPQGQAAAQVANEQAMPMGPAIAWPTYMRFAGEPDAIFDPDFLFDVIDRPYNPTTLVTTFDFVDAPTGTQLFAPRVEAGWNMDEVRNYATLNRTFGTPQVAESSGSVARYGVSAVAFTNLGYNADSQVAEDVPNWANRWDTPEYAARQVTTSFKAVSSRCADAAYASWADLLDVATGLFAQANVTYEPTGSSTARTDVCVTFGRTIQWTPADTRVVLNVVPAANYRSFVLDSTSLGVLDQNRLG